MSVHDALLTILRGDAELAALLPGGIHDTPLTATTPGAWVADPLTQVKRLQPCAVMLAPQEVDHPFGLNPGRRIDIDLWPDLYVYAERADMAATFDAADSRAMELLHGLRLDLADIDATGHRGAPLSADELPGDVWHIYRRYRVQTVRHIQGAS